MNDQAPDIQSASNTAGQQNFAALKGQTILVTGVTGFLAQALVPQLVGLGVQCYLLMHSTQPTYKNIDKAKFTVIQSTDELSSHQVTKLDAIIHLAGAGIGDWPWTEKRRQLLRTSRLKNLDQIVDTLIANNISVNSILAASAIGFYGDQHAADDQSRTEKMPAGKGFAADLCVLLEKNLENKVQRLGCRGVALRFGVILGGDGGVLQRLLPSFKLGLGAVLGNGRQWFSWVSRTDAVDAILLSLCTKDLAGPVNVVSPNPVRFREFAQLLAKKLNKPLILRVPALALRLLGDMSSLFLASCKVEPTQLIEHNFVFNCSHLDLTLSEILEANEI